MNVGILGGTFDPVHNGHLALGQAALSALTLDTVLFIPAGEPWRKSEQRITPAEHRLAMLKLAIEGHAAFGISDIELRREGATYTADTLEALAAERLDDQFWFIVGADALADLPKWHEPQRIVKHATLAVAPRERHALDLGALESAGIPRTRVATFAMAPVDVSSRDIRARIAANAPVDDLLPSGVRAYIREHRLYV